MNTLIVYLLSNVLKFLNFSDCFRVTRNGFAQSKGLFGEGTKEEEQRAREGNAATQAYKPTAGFVPDDLTCFSNPPKDISEHN